MIATSLLNRGSLVLAGALALFALISPVHAQELSDRPKMAGAIPLTLELLDKVDKFTKTVSGDPATTAEWIASSKDTAISSESPSTVVNSKYPRLAAAFKTASLTPEDFVKVYGAVLMTGVLAEMDTPQTDKKAEANITFYKANKDRMTATINSLEAMDNATHSPSSPTPSASPASSQ